MLGGKSSMAGSRPSLREREIDLAPDRPDGDDGGARLMGRGATRAGQPDNIML
jgi:hypothetical protein